MVRSTEFNLFFIAVKPIKIFGLFFFGVPEKSIKYSF